MPCNGHRLEVASRSIIRSKSIIRTRISAISIAPSPDVMLLNENYVYRDRFSGGLIRSRQPNSGQNILTAYCAVSQSVFNVATIFIPLRSRTTRRQRYLTCRACLFTRPDRFVWLCTGQVKNAGLGLTEQTNRLQSLYIGDIGIEIGVIYDTAMIYVNGYDRHLLIAFLLVGFRCAPMRRISAAGSAGRLMRISCESIAFVVDDIHISF